MVQVGLLGGAYTAIQTTLAASSRIDELFGLEPTVNDGPESIAEFRDRIALNDVEFEYGGKRVLSGVSFAIAKGDVVAQGGPCGAGKLTLAILLPCPSTHHLVDSNQAVRVLRQLMISAH